MKLTIEKSKLLEKLQAAQGAVGGKSHVPILSCVLLKTVCSPGFSPSSDNSLTVIASDIDTHISAKADASIERPGAVCLSAKRLTDVVRCIAGAELSLEVDEKNVATIRAGSSVFRIRGLPAEDFIALPVLKDAKSITLPQARLKSMLRMTSYAVSIGDGRYILEGVLFELKDAFRLVATNGRRICIAELESIPGSTGILPASGEGHQFILPTKAAKELSRLLADTEDSVAISFSESHASFALGDILLTSKPLDGNYPNWHAPIPAETKERVTFNRQELLDAVGRAAIMTTDRNIAVNLAFTKNELTLTSNSPDTGESSEVLLINYHGSDVKIAFNPDYLMEPLQNLSADEVQFEFTDGLSPGILRAPGFLNVTMPMRLS